MTQATFSRSALVLVLLCAASSACGGGPSAPPQAAANSAWLLTAVAPSIVEITQDDRATADALVADAENSLADESRAPRHVVKVRERESASFQPTGFVIEGGLVVTAAHFILRPDRVRMTTRQGRTVDGRVTHIDDVRDIAIVQPKSPLDAVPALVLSDLEPQLGQPLWTMTASGHGSSGTFSGAAAGIASGAADVFGARTIFFGAVTSRGFAGAPVIALDENSRPVVVGMGRDLPGSDSPAPPLSAAVTVKELRAVMAGRPHPIQRALGDYARAQRSRTYADLFVTSRLALGRDAAGEQVAWIDGVTTGLGSAHPPATLACVAALFGLPSGEATISFELRDPGDLLMATVPRLVHIDDSRRAALASVTFRFDPKTHGRYFIVARRGGTELGRTSAMLGLDDDDDELVEIDDSDPVEDGEPDVDVVVTLARPGDDGQPWEVRSAWSVPSLPRRVGFSWFARGTRGWSIHGADMTAYVLDESGTVVGRADGCSALHATPQHPWACWARTPESQFVRAEREGIYDIVFTVGDRPVAWWPMAAVVTKDAAPGSDVERWIRELQRTEATRRQKTSPPNPLETAPTDSTPPEAHPPAAAPKGSGSPATRHSK